MTQINFRLLHSADLENYQRIRLECLTNYPDYFGDTYEEEINADSLKFNKTFVSHDDTSFLFGAFSQDIPIGICGFIQQKRIKARHRGDLVQVYVNPSFAGQGIGSHLIKLTIAKAFKNILTDQILLSVVYTNDRAVNLYKKLGFVQYGFIEGFFKQANNSWSQLFMVLTRRDYMTANNFQEKRECAFFARR